MATRRVRCSFTIAALLATTLGVLVVSPLDAQAQRKAPSGARVEEAQRLRAEALELGNAGKLDEAKPLLEKALALREKALGISNLDTLSIANDLADVLFAKGDYRAAEPYYLRVIAGVEKGLGPNDPSLGALYNNMALVGRLEKDYPRAISFGERALAVREKTVGPDSADVVVSLSLLSLMHREAGQPALGIPPAEREVAIGEKLFGKDSPRITQPLADLGQAYRAAGDYKRAAATVERALLAIEKSAGKESLDVTGPLGDLAGIHEDAGDYGRAADSMARIVSIREKELGADKKETLGALSDLAVLYSRAGDYDRALAAAEKVIAAYEKSADVVHLGTALNNLAEIRLTRGDLVGAEPLYERAVALMEKALGPDDPDVGVVVNNLASLYYARGDAERAKPLFARALAVREKALGPDHPDVAAALGNLAEIYLHGGDFAAAEPLFVRALAIRTKALGPDHPLVGLALHNLGALYLERGDGARAEPMLRNALAVREKRLGKDHPAVAETLGLLASLAQDRGDLAGAEAMFLRAVSIDKGALGKEHPDVANALHNLATTYEAEGALDKALKAYERANAIREKHLALVIATGSEDQKLAYAEMLTGLTHSTVSFNLRSMPKSAEATRLALTTILQRKGRVLDAVTGGIGALRARLGAEDQAALDDLAGVRAELARAVLRGASSDAERANQDTLEKRAREIELGLGRRSAEFRAISAPVTLDAVVAALPEGTALVELFVYAPFDAKALYGKRYSADHYAAYVARRGADVAAIDLGPVATIDARVQTLRAALADPARSDVKELARGLDELVMQPIRALLGDAHVVALSPDGALNLVPIAALVDESGHFLVERTSFTYLTSGRDLLRFATHAASRSGPSIVANPSFDVAPSNEAGAPRGDRGGGLGKAHFSPLPGTAAEAKAIGAVLPGSTQFTESAATKTALEAMHGPSILHVATHGFFLAGRAAAAATSRGLELEGGGQGAGLAIENPLLRSGLALAGANAPAGERERGILTALEASGLDLYGTKLVVLSACETGVGNVKSGDGVYGLRRALVIAGSETQVMSLWKVDDAATRDLMTGYYRALEAGEARGEALRGVELAMIANPAVAHPYYWASFIVSGDPTTLDAKPALPHLAKVTPGARGCACEISEEGDVKTVWLGAVLALSAIAARRKRVTTGEKGGEDA